MATQTFIPKQLAAGDGFSFIKTNPCFPSNGYSMKFVIQAPTPIIIDAGSDHTVTGQIPADAVPGIYPVAYVFTDLATSLPRTKILGSMMIIGSALQPRVLSAKENLLASVEAALSSIGGSEFSQVTINGEQFTAQDMTKLVSWRNQLVVEVSAEQAAMGMKPSQVGQKTIRGVFR
jgi:hypothetical protein